MKIKARFLLDMKVERAGKVILIPCGHEEQKVAG
jgi:hypothetical protein